MQKSVSGFTFIEVVLSVAVTLLLGTTAAWLSIQFSEERQIDSIEDQIAGSIRLAQLKAFSGKNDSKFGVAYRDQALVLFQGDRYDDRVVDFDERFPIDDPGTITGFDEIVFSSPDGRLSESVEFSIIFREKIRTYVLTREGALREQ